MNPADNDQDKFVSDRNITNAPEDRLDEAALREPKAPEALPQSLEGVPPAIREKILHVLHQAALKEYLREALHGSPTPVQTVRKLIAQAQREPDENAKREIAQTILKLVIPNGVKVSGRVDVLILIKELADLGVQGIFRLDSDDVRLGMEDDITDSRKEGAFHPKSGEIGFDPESLKKIGVARGQIWMEQSVEGFPIRTLGTRQVEEFVWNGAGLKLHTRPKPE